MNELIILAVLLGVVCALAANEAVVPEAQLPAATYHRWAHSHWVWAHHNVGNQTNCENLIKDYTSRGIKVGGFNIDSEWATQFNNFEVRFK